jgi:2'-N-acetylparomamine deacetylase / 2'''-acetyl-6'''-hydroxyneomycin deacetylase
MTARAQSRGPLLVLSPHSDDAALSVGGLLLRLRTRVVLHTVFGRSNYTRDGFHDDWRGVTAARRAEDAAYAAKVGATLRYGVLPEAAIRIQPSIRNVFARRGGRVPPCAMLPEALDRLISVVRPRAIMSPAALGRHIDHLVVRREVRRAGRRHGVPIAYYEDLPYAARIAARRIEREIHAFDARVEPIVVDISQELARKTRHLRFYPSQLGTDERRDVRRHAQRWGRSATERVWSRWPRETILGVEA